MSTLTIRDVPDEYVRKFKSRAAQAGQSLQAYLLELVAREASKPTNAELMERLNRETTADVSTEEILAAIDEGRAGR